MKRSRMFVSFSCGAPSAVAAHIATKHYRDEYDVEVYYCDLSKDEHPDNQRFKADVERWIGQPVAMLKSEKYADVADVQLKRRYIKGVGGAPCTTWLKRKVRESHQRPDDVHVIGFTADEPDRIANFEASFPHLDCEWVLRDRGINKADCFSIMKSVGIELPMMYRLGFNNANCIGCVKGGMGYWNKIRREFPERFASQAAREREIGATILRKNGKPLYLDELDPNAGRHDDLDTAECGYFCEPAIRKVDLTIGETTP